MSVTRRVGRCGSGRGRLSLRSRLLAGLITVTTLFLIVMGVVTTVVLGNSEQDQFNSDLVLAARVKPIDIAGLQGGYAVAYYDTVTRSVAALSPTSHALTELERYLNELVDSRGLLAFREQNPPGELFGIAQPGEPALTAIYRQVTMQE